MWIKRQLAKPCLYNIVPLVVKRLHNLQKLEHRQHAPLNISDLCNTGRRFHNTKMSDYFEQALRFTKEAGDLIRERNSSANKHVALKSGDIDLVTETDQQVEKLLISNLSKQFPGHLFIGEESVANGEQCNLTDAPTWIIDPIDGTMNFVHQFPHSCISIALFINKQPELGIIYNPVLEQLFSAQKGQGAYLNGKKVHVSDQKDLSKALIMMEFGTSRDAEKLKVVAQNQSNLMNQAHGLRALGSAALDMAMVATGAADAYFEFGIHVWDIAAGEIIVKEAGGVILDPSGGPIDRLSRRVLAASSEELSRKLVKVLAQYHPTPRD